MHWMYGIGQIVNLEERVLAGSRLLYYEVHVQDLNVWVPADSKVTSRLRSPTPKLRFKRILTILSEPSDPLPEDRLQRKTHLQERMKDCSVASLCQVIRDLFAHQKVQPLEDHDFIMVFFFKFCTPRASSVPASKKTTR